MLLCASDETKSKQDIVQSKCDNYVDAAFLHHLKATRLLAVTSFALATLDTIANSNAAFFVPRVSLKKVSYFLWLHGNPVNPNISLLDTRASSLGKIHLLV